MEETSKGMVSVGKVQLIGRLRLGFESHEFTPDGADDGWWCTIDPAVERDIQAKYGKSCSELFGVHNRDTVVEVEGDLSCEGQFGHMNLWSREILIHKIRPIQLPQRPKR